jgi:hypothetical protein
MFVQLSAKAIVILGCLFVVVYSSQSAHSEPTPANWALDRSNGGFPHRDTARYFRWANQHWMSNGYVYGGKALRDLYRSPNGRDWILVNGATPYPAYSPIAPHGERIFVVGHDKVRTTRDGMKYETILDPTPFAGNFVESPFIGNFVAADETTAKMYLFMPDGIHYSENGVTWNTVTPPWPPSYANFIGLAYKGRVYILGGALFEPNTPPEPRDAGKTSLRVVWSSDKPEESNSWIKTEAPWAERMWPSASIHAGEIYLTGGFSNTMGLNFNDTWRYDGKTWRRVWTPVSYTSRHAAVQFSFNGLLHLVGGNRNPDESTTTSDVWLLAAP